MVKRHTFYSIKKTCTILLLISFFLPMARSCSEFQLPQQDVHKSDESSVWFTYKNETPKTYYPWNFISGNNVSEDESFFFLIFCYLWPIPFLWFHKKARKKVTTFLVLSVELFLCLLASYLILLPGLFGGLAYGAYISLTSISIYFLTSASEIIYDLRILILNKINNTS